MGEGALERIRGGAPADEMTVLAALREEVECLDPLAEVEVSGGAGKERIRIHRGSDETATISLHNLWRQLRDADGEAAARAIERFARLFSSDFSEYERAAESGKVMPMIRDRAGVDALGKDDSAPARRELSTCGTLLVCFVLDTPEYVCYPSMSDLDRHGLPDPSAAEEAIANLASHASDSGLLRVERQPFLPEEKCAGFLEDYRDVIVHRAFLDGDYDASLILLAGLARNLCDDPESPLVHLDGPLDMAFALPARDTLLIVDARDGHAVEALSMMARTIRDNAAYAISPHVYRYIPSDGQVMLEPMDLP